MELPKRQVSQAQQGTKSARDAAAITSQVLSHIAVMDDEEPTRWGELPPSQGAPPTTTIACQQIQMTRDAAAITSQVLSHIAVMDGEEPTQRGGLPPSQGAPPTASISDQSVTGQIRTVAPVDQESGHPISQRDGRVAGQCITHSVGLATPPRGAADRDDRDATVRDRQGEGAKEVKQKTGEAATFDEQQRKQALLRKKLRLEQQAAQPQGTSYWTRHRGQGKVKPSEFSGSGAADKEVCESGNQRSTRSVRSPDTTVTVATEKGAAATSSEPKDCKNQQE